MHFNIYFNAGAALSFQSPRQFFKEYFNENNYENRAGSYIRVVAFSDSGFFTISTFAG